MKKILLFLVISMMMLSLALAQGQQQGNQSITNENKGPEATENMSNENVPDQQRQGNLRKVRPQEYNVGKGRQAAIYERNGGLQLRTGNSSANTSLNMTYEEGQNKSRLYARLSNGRNSEIKIMPDQASERAIERLKINACSEENNCSIELKETGKGNQTRAIYNMKAKKQARVLGLFKTKMQVEAQVDAESGEVVQSKRPWWAFMASE